MTGAPRPTADYILRVRDASRVLVGEVDSFDSFGAVLRYNNVSTWRLALDAAHPMAGYLATKGYGLQVVRNVRDTSGVLIPSASGVLMSGPVRSIRRKKAGNVLEVAGVDDLCWLAARDAWPVVSYPLPAYISALSGLLRYYKLGEASGTTATDTSSLANGTYTNTAGITYGVFPGPADDAATAVTLNGSTGYVSVPTTSLPTGNASWYLAIAFKLPTVAQASDVVLLGMGTWGTTRACPHLGIKAANNGVYTSTFNVGSTVTALTPGSTHAAVATYDGTNLKLFLDGLLLSSTVPGTLVVAYGAAAVGAQPGAGGGFFGGAGSALGHAVMGSGTMTDATAQTLSLMLLTRFAASAYDTRSGVAETVIKAYVSANASSSAIKDALGLSRSVSGLTVATDSGRGSSVTGNARFDPLLAGDGSGLLQSLALSGGIGMTLKQSGTALVFDCFTPTDRTASVIFSDDLGNVADYEYEVTAPDLDANGNVVVVGGGGGGTARTFLMASDASSITSWGRAEVFRDARDTSDAATLTQRASETLAQAAEQTRFSATLAPQEALAYGVDFGLGDRVTVTVDGVAWSEIVREVDIDLSRDGTETITPAVGTPNTDLIESFLGSYARTMRAVAGRVARLERTQ